MGALVVFSRFCPFWAGLRLRCVGAGVGGCEVVVVGHRPDSHWHWHWRSEHRVVLQVGGSQA